MPRECHQAHQVSFRPNKNDEIKFETMEAGVLIYCFDGHSQLLTQVSE